jgi:hypothetical protein
MLLLIVGWARDGAADTLSVSCSTGDSISAAIASLPENSTTEPHTINVSGTCNESVNIVNRQRITIQGPATIVASPGGTGVLVAGSHAITLRRLTIQGGGRGVDIVRNSEVVVESCTIESNDVGVQANQQSLVIVSGTPAAPTLVQNNVFLGIAVQNSSHLQVQGPAGAVVVQGSEDGVLVGGSTAALGNVSITGNRGVGLIIQGGSADAGPGGQISNNGAAPDPGELQGGVFIGNRALFSANGTTISGNTGDGVSVGAEFAVNGTLRLTNATVSGNSGNGVDASVGASVGLVGSSITGNTLDGIHLTKASIAGLPDAPGPPPAVPPNTITGNGGRGIFCDNTSQAFGDLSGINGRRTCTN